MVEYVRPTFVMQGGLPSMQCPLCSCRMLPEKGWSIDGEKGYWLWFRCGENRSHITKAIEIEPPALTEGEEGGSGPGQSQRSSIPLLLGPSPSVSAQRQ